MEVSYEMVDNHEVIERWSNHQRRLALNRVIVVQSSNKSLQRGRSSDVSSYANFQWDPVKLPEDETSVVCRAVIQSANSLDTTPIKSRTTGMAESKNCVRTQPIRKKD